MLFARLTTLVAAGLIVLLSLTGGEAIAQEVKAENGVLRMAVINLQKIDREATIFASIRSQIETYRQSFQSLIQAEEDELRKADRELARQRTILAPEAYSAERQKFEKRIVDFQRRGQKRKQDLEAAREQALVEARNIVRKVVNDIAAENKITFIFRSDMVVTYAKEMDITDYVLEKLNATQSTIKVPELKE